jgi:hypothetical protein
MRALLRYLLRCAPGAFVMCGWVPQFYSEQFYLEQDYPERVVASDDLPPEHPEQLCRRPLDRTERRIWAELTDLDCSGGPEIMG